MYELGFKWEGLDRRLRLNAAVFTSDYDDVQITPLFEGIGPVARNAGEAEINGLEFEWMFAPIESWDFRGGLWQITLRGENLSDEEYIIAGNAERYTGNIGYTQATYARPREYWISIRRMF